MKRKIFIGMLLMAVSLVFGACGKANLSEVSENQTEEQNISVHWD